MLKKRSPNIDMPSYKKHVLKEYKAIVERTPGIGSMRWSSYMTLPDVLMILLLYLPLFIILYMTIRGKYGIPRKTIWINAVYALLIAVLQLVLRNWKWIGVLGAAESLFEGCVYIKLVIYWEQKIKKGTGEQPVQC